MTPKICKDYVTISFPIRTDEECEYWLVPVDSVDNIKDMDRDHAWITPDGKFYVFDGKKLVHVNDHENLKVKWGNVIGDIKNQKDLQDVFKQLTDSIAKTDKKVEDVKGTCVKNITVNGDKVERSEDGAVNVEVPKNVSELANDANYVNQEELDGTLGDYVKGLVVNGESIEKDEDGIVSFNVSGATQSDWEETREDNSAFIKNKPFYKKTTVEVESYAEGNVGLELSHAISDFNTDTGIEYGGKLYHSVVFDSESTWHAGNKHLVDSSAKDNGEPFYLAGTISQSNGQNFIDFTEFTYNGAYNTFSVVNEVIKKIPQEYLPCPRIFFSATDDAPNGWKNGDILFVVDGYEGE